MGKGIINLRVDSVASFDNTKLGLNVVKSKRVRPQYILVRSPGLDFCQELNASVRAVGTMLRLSYSLR